MTYWAFCEDLSSDNIVIGDAEAHHLLNVLRLSPGANLTAFDGCGTEAHVIVEKTTRRDLSCRVVSRVLHSNQRTSSITVIASPPKADRLKWMVEKLTEIGVDRLVLLNTQRTVVTPGDARVDKLQANVVSACKQCKRPLLMRVEPLQSLSAVLATAASSNQLGRLFVAHPDTTAVAANENQSICDNNISVLIGPEGGFTDEEVNAALLAGATPMSWPSTILRIETASIVFATLLMSRQNCSSGVGRKIE